MPNELLAPYLPIFSAQEDADLLDGTISAILGGSTPILLANESWPRCGNCEQPLIPYIQLNVSSAHTPSEFRTKVGVRPTPGHAVVLQIFVCAEDENAECFQNCVVSGGGQGTADDPASWLVRVVQIAPGAIQDPETVADACAELGEEKFYIQQRVISGWAAGRPEMMHEEANYDFDEELYASHQPASGLKLLGFPVQGQYFSSTFEECPRGDEEDTGDESEDGEGQAHQWRCLLQLGTSTEGDAPLCVIGNTWINQCALHPEVLSMTIGGNW